MWVVQALLGVRVGAGCGDELIDVLAHCTGSASLIPSSRLTPSCVQSMTAQPWRPSTMHVAAPSSRFCCCGLPCPPLHPTHPPLPPQRSPRSPATPAAPTHPHSPPHQPTRLWRQPHGRVNECPLVVRVPRVLGEHGPHGAGARPEGGHVHVHQRVGQGAGRGRGSSAGGGRGCGVRGNGGRGEGSRCGQHGSHSAAGGGGRGAWGMVQGGKGG